MDSVFFIDFVQSAERSEHSVARLVARGGEREGEGNEIKKKGASVPVSHNEGGDVVLRERERAVGERRLRTTERV